jgi:hypothetical protein
MLTRAKFTADLTGRHLLKVIADKKLLEGVNALRGCAQRRFSGDEFPKAWNAVQVDASIQHRVGFEAAQQKYNIRTLARRPAHGAEILY